MPKLERVVDNRRAVACYGAILAFLAVVFGAQFFANRGKTSWCSIDNRSTTPVAPPGNDPLRRAQSARFRMAGPWLLHLEVVETQEFCRVRNRIRRDCRHWARTSAG